MLRKLFAAKHVPLTSHERDKLEKSVLEEVAKLAPLLYVRGAVLCCPARACAHGCAYGRGRGTPAEYQYVRYLGKYPYYGMSMWEVEVRRGGDEACGRVACACSRSSGAGVRSTLPIPMPPRALWCAWALARVTWRSSTATRWCAAARALARARRD